MTLKLLYTFQLLFDSKCHKFLCKDGILQTSFEFLHVIDYFHSLSQFCSFGDSIQIFKIQFKS